MTIEIPLSKSGKKYSGQFVAIVSKEYQYLSAFNWSVSRSKKVNYAMRATLEDGKPKTLLLHRVIMEIFLGHELSPEEEVDHVDGNGLNCTIENLRIATKAQNQANRGNPSNNTSGIKGVDWNKHAGKWRASITVNQRWKFLGYFDNIENARQARIEAEILYFKEFSKIK